MKRLKLLSVTFLALLVASPRVSHSQTTVNSDPVGFVTTTIPAANPGAKTVLFSPVLHAAPNITGPVLGVLSSVSSNSVTATSNGWTPGSLASNNAYLYLTSGAQDGLVLRITGNTTNQITLDTMGLSLSSAGVTTNNTFRLLVGETVSSLFGTGVSSNAPNMVLGGSSTQFSRRVVDTIVLLDQSRTLRTIYYDTASGKWLRSGSGSDMGSTPIPPFSGVLYTRVATQPFTLMQRGTVPTKPVKYIVPPNGTVFLGRFFPQDGTLGAFNLNNLPGWNNTSQAGITSVNADKVVTTDSTGALRQFFFNGTNWIRAGSGSAQNNVPVPAAGAVYTLRAGSGAAQILTVPLPYTL